jgi:hypothetical protein
MSFARPANNYDRFDPSKNYERHLFIAGRALQSAELDEIQSNAEFRLKSVGDALFRDGNIIRDGRIVVASDTGLVKCEGAAIYVRGAVRGVPARQFTISTSGTVAIGVRLVDTVVTHADDAALLDPAIGLRNYQDPGAARLMTTPSWSWDGEDGGDFFPIYYVDDGLVRPKEAPPTVDALSLSLAKYDRDSAGGTYVVEGLRVSVDADQEDGKQVYNVMQGRARVYGWPIDLQASRRIVYDAEPYQRTLTAEPHVATGGTERVDTDRNPIANIDLITVVKEVTETVVHGSFLGTQDPLAHGSVLSIIEVKQGGYTYTPTTDYLLTAGNVNWAPGGAEPATGSSYTVKYRYIATVDPESPDATGFSVTGVVAGQLIQVTYSYYVPRIDRLCLNRDGIFLWVRGVSADFNAFVPDVGPDLLPLAAVYQTWNADRQVRIDGARMVPMTELALIQGKLDRLIMLVALTDLKQDANLRDTALKKSLFVDPLLDDSMRDQGVAQTGAIVDGTLLLPLDLTATRLSDDITSAQFLPATPSVIVQQPLRTGSMQINPYMAFAPVPAEVTLDPAFDHWTEVAVTWASPVTSRLASFLLQAIPNGGSLGGASVTTSDVVLSTTNRPAEYLRPIVVHFTIKGFAPGEALTSVTFDGVAVTAT